MLRLRKNIDEVSTTSTKANTTRLAKLQERSATEVERLRDEVKEARESIARSCGAEERE